MPALASLLLGACVATAPPVQPPTGGLARVRPEVRAALPRAPVPAAANAPQDRRQQKPVVPAAQTVAGPPRWDGSAEMEAQFSRLLDQRDNNTGMVEARPVLASLRLLEESVRPRSFVLPDGKVDARFEELVCDYERPGIAGRHTLRFFRPGQRPALAASIVSDFRREAGAQVDMEVATCPPTLLEAMELAWGPESAQRVSQQYVRRHQVEPICVAELAAEAARPQLSERERRQLAGYQRVNVDRQAREGVWRAAVRAHFPNRPQSGVVLLDNDDSPVGACILKWLLEASTDSATRGVAAEGLALRMLRGGGAPKDPTGAAALMERAATQWRYGAAALWLGQQQLAKGRDPESVRKAVAWLQMAHRDASTTFVGSANDPGKAAPLLFDIYLTGQYGPRDTAAAESLYRDIMKANPNSRLLLDTLPRIPGLKAKLDREERARRQAAQEAAERAAARRRTCPVFTRTDRHGNTSSVRGACY